MMVPISVKVKFEEYEDTVLEMMKSILNNLDN